MATSHTNTHNPRRDHSGITFLSCMSPVRYRDSGHTSLFNIGHAFADSFIRTREPVAAQHQTARPVDDVAPSPPTTNAQTDAGIRGGQTAGHTTMHTDTASNDNGMRRWGFLPLRRFNVYRFMTNLKRLHAIEVMFGCIMLLINSAVLLISLRKEVGCFYSLTTWLIILTGIACVRIPGQAYIIHKLQVLQREWIQQSVTHDLVSLCKGPLCVFNRLLAIVNFVWYFIGFRWAYYTGSCGSTSPFIFQYITVLILIFLALVGLNSVICLFSLAYVLYTVCLNHNAMAAMFQDINRGAMPVPKRVLKRLTSLEWKGNESRDAIIALKNEQNHINGSITADDESDFVCAICLCEYEVGQRIRILPCLHNFHKNCIDEWFRSHSTCPLRCHINLLSPDCIVNMQHCHSLRRSGVVPSPIASPSATSRATARLGRLCFNTSHTHTEIPENFHTHTLSQHEQPQDGTLGENSDVPLTILVPQRQTLAEGAGESFSTPTAVEAHLSPTHIHIRRSTDAHSHTLLAADAGVYTSHSFQSCTACSAVSAILEGNTDGGV